MLGHFPEAKTLTCQGTIRNLQVRNAYGCRRPRVLEDFKVAIIFGYPVIGAPINSTRRYIYRGNEEVKASIESRMGQRYRRTTLVPTSSSILSLHFATINQRVTRISNFTGRV